MELSEKNGQASMEEILASIRRIIAEEPGAANPVIQLNPAPVQVKGDGLLDDPSDFDLPSMFRNGSNGAQERPAPLLGRLTDAIRAASGAAPADTQHSDMSLSSLRLPRSGTTSSPQFPDPSPPPSAAPPFQLSAFHESTVGQRPDEQALEPAAPEASATPVMTEAPLSGTGSGTPEVPRQMAAFKDTRFRGMGSQPTIAPVDVQTLPVSAATAFASPMPAVAEAAPAIAHDEPDPAPATPALSYPAYGLASDGHATADPSAGPVSVPATPPAVPQVPAPVAPQDNFASAPIEDTTADLLRPMLRQWLAENMPRMVEKALHIEVAEAVKSPRKP